MDSLLDDLIDCLDLEATEAPDTFLGRCERRRPHGRIFGGQVLAQALMAAGRTVPGRPAHSMQALFLRAGDPERTIAFEVERLRDGRSFSARRVVARQGGDAILALQASFHALEAGYEHQQAAPDAPDPDTLPPFRELAAAQRAKIPAPYASWAAEPRPLEVRFAVLPSYLGAAPSPEPGLTWFRAEGELPDDPLLHQCLLAYASDIGLNDTAYRVHCGADDPPLQAMSSVDHAMWFHTPTRADEWTLYHQQSPRAARARGFARGAMYSRAGVLVASTGQDSLMRPERGGA